MGHIEQLAENYGQHIAMPWQQTVAGAQRVIMVVYEKERERTLIARKAAFETVTRQTGHDWHEVDISSAFAHWMASQRYRDSYFASPDDLKLKLDSDFAGYVVKQIRAVLEREDITKNSVVGIFGVGALFGFTRVSHILKLVEPFIKGRLAVFFPGTFDQNNYRLLDARDGWNYLAIPITLHSSGVF